MEISIRLNYIVIGLITLIVSTLGRVFSSAGMRWYYTLKLPSFTPPSWVFGIVWTIIFVATATAVALVWNRFERDRQFWLIIGMSCGRISFLINITSLLRLQMPYCFS